MLAANGFMIAFRIVHILAGVFWVGSAFLFVVYVQPSAAAIAPAGAPFMSELLGKRRLVDGIITMGAISVAGGLIPPGTVFAPSDSIHASSNFHGLDLGVVGELSRGPWMLEWRAKVALGANINEAQINGSTTITAGGVTTTSPGDCWRSRVISAATTKPASPQFRILS